MPSAEQVTNVKNILQAYQTRVRSIVSTHKKTVKQAVEEADRRKTKKILKRLGKA
jgi:ADP-dependent phosphofructokinase/glucokinase